MSPVQLADQRFPAKVVAALDAAGLAPGRLEVELTETAMVEDTASAVSALAQLRALGVRVSMDDFGTGYSSLTHLRTFELDRIKVDRSFVASALEDRSCMAVLRAVVAMGGDLDVPVLGEGVETAEQLDLLAAIGCEGAQGYYLGRPMDGDAADALASEVAAEITVGRGEADGATGTENALNAA